MENEGKEVIFRGSLILDGTPMTEEEQRERVFKLMEIAGIKLSEEDKKETEIGYEGVQDEDGISETQTTEFVVYKSKKNIDDNVYDEDKREELELYNLQLKELKRLREKIIQDEAKIRSITPAKRSKQNKIAEYDQEIAEFEKVTKEYAKEYEESYKRLQEIIKKEQEELNSQKLLSEQEIESIKEKYGLLKEEENKKSIELKETLNNRKIHLNYLKKQKDNLEKVIADSEALGFTVEEYQDLTSTLRKTNIINAILKEKGLEEIISKKASDRTKEEKALLKQTKDDILKELIEYKKENKEKSAKDGIEVLYSLNVNYNRKGNAKVMKLTDSDIKAVKENVAEMPVKVQKPADLGIDYEPAPAPEDMMDESTSKSEKITAEEIKKRIIEGLDSLLEEQKKKNSEEPNINEKITIYKEKDTDDYYASRSTLERFGLKENENSIKVNGIKCYKLSADELESIINNNDNETAPYLLDLIDIEKEDDKSDTDKIGQDLLDRLNALLEEQKAKNREESNIKEKITVYKDEEKGIYYVSKITLDRFDTKESGEAIEINGIKCYPISSELFSKILDSSKNEYSPFLLNVVATKTKSQPTQVQESTEPVKGSEQETQPQTIPVQESTEPVKGSEQETQPQTTPTQKNDYHVEEIIEEITNGLNIKAKAGQRYIASNINVKEKFKEELHSGNYAYNVVHVIPNIAKSIIRFGNKLSSKLLLSNKAKEAMKEVETRLNNLESEKLEVLFNEYKGKQLRVDMNNQINGLILNRLKDYTSSVLEVLNQNIKQSYANLFVVLGQVKELEKKENKTAEEKQNRDELMQQAATYVRNILELRKEADNYLAGGIEGLEKDYEIVAKKYPYLGLSFAKTKDFDNKLQKVLAEHGRKLKEGLANDNPEEIVNNFVQLEANYHYNTKVSKSVFGKRSTGTKYYENDSEMGKIIDDYIQSSLPQEVTEEKSK